MKSLRNKVIMSAIVLVFAVIATIGSTYAWFTVSSTVDVTSIDITVVTEDALLFRAWNTTDGPSNDGAAPETTWTEDDYFNTVNLLDTDNDGTNDGYYHGGGTTGLSSWRLTPVTPVAGESAGNTVYTSLDLTTFRDVVLSAESATTRTYTSASPNISGGGYVELKFWMISLSTASTKTVDLTGLTVTSSNQNLIDCLYFGILGDSDATQNVFAANESSIDYGFAFGEFDNGYSTTTTINSIADNTPLLAAVGAVADSDTVATITTGLAGAELLRIFIWIEGWDAQATNALMGDQLSIEFTFGLN